MSTSPLLVLIFFRTSRYDFLGGGVGNGCNSTQKLVCTYVPTIKEKVSVSLCNCIKIQFFCSIPYAESTTTYKNETSDQLINHVNYKYDLLVRSQIVTWELCNMRAGCCFGNWRGMAKWTCSITMCSMSLANELINNCKAKWKNKKEMVQIIKKSWSKECKFIRSVRLNSS
jgi:hypothetical protein